MADEPMAGQEETGGSGRTRASKPGSLAWLWMLLALVGVGGFLTWLGMEAKPTSVVVAEEEDPTVMDPPSILVVSKDSLATDKAGFVARDIRVHNIAATGNLGPRIFWGELGDPTNQVPILVRLDSAAAEGFTAQMGAFYSIRGRVFPMNDSIAKAWGEAGEFSSDGNELQAEFADYYMQATDIRPTPAALREDNTPAGPAPDSTGAMDGNGMSDGAMSDGGASG